MKKYIIIITAHLISFYALCQEHRELSVFETDTTWIKEIIKFPIGFAQNIKYEGFEDLRFPQGWSKEESPNFWSYVWAWSIENKKEFTVSELEQNIQFYFDGLLGLDFYKIDGKPQPKTNAVFIKNGKSFIGKVKTIDTRYTKKPMTLYAEAESQYCAETKKAIIVFRFSPKPYNHDVWDRLQSVKFIDDVCEH